MVVNFRVCEISRGARKLAWTPTLNLKKNYLNKTHLKVTLFQMNYFISMSFHQV